MDWDPGAFRACTMNFSCDKSAEQFFNRYAKSAGQFFNAQLVIQDKLRGVDRGVWRILWIGSGT